MSTTASSTILARGSGFPSRVAFLGVVRRAFSYAGLLLCLLLLTLSPASLASPPAALLATITVDRTDDTATASACTAAGGDCSLRGATIYANANPGATISRPASISSPSTAPPRPATAATRPSATWTLPATTRSFKAPARPRRSSGRRGRTTA